MAKKAKRRTERTANAEKKENPFERQVNKVKHAALGRKVCRNEIGKPFESRAKAFKKRKETLFNEYLKRDKRGKGVVDNRLKQDAPEGAALRKASVWKLKNKLNNEHFSLTHKGVDLSEAKLNDNFSDLEDDDNDFDLLRRSDYVESAHFGGGEGGAAKTAKDFVNEIIADKKQKQLEKEETIELTEKLDQDWANVRNLLRHKGPKVDQNIEKTDYDLLVKQLSFNDNQRKANIPIVRKVDDSEEMRPEVARSKSKLFLEKVDLMIQNQETSQVSDCLKSLLEFENLNSSVLSELKDKLSNISPNEISVQSLSLLSICSVFPPLKNLVHLKLIQLLQSPKYNSVRDFVKCLCLIKFIMKILEGKFIPELIHTLRNCFVLCCGEKYFHLFLPAFKAKKVKINLLMLNEFSYLQSENDISDLDLFSAFDSNVEFDDDNLTKLRVIKALFTLTENVIENYRNLPSFNEMFTDIKDLVKHIRSNVSSVKELQTMAENVHSQLCSKKERQYLFREKPRPLMLPMYEPKIESRRPEDSKKKLVKKYKREFKGAQRELKKDTQFLKDVWLKETLRKDEERKRKVKQLMGELSTELGLYKKKKKRR